MTSNHLLTAMATSALLASGLAFATVEREGADLSGPRVARDGCGSDARGDPRSDRERHARHERKNDETRAKKALYEVPNGSSPDQASYGWQYYSNARTKVAVVISPAGEYFLNRGDGLRQITGPAGSPSIAPAAPD